MNKNVWIEFISEQMRLVKADLRQVKDKLQELKEDLHKRNGTFLVKLPGCYMNSALSFVHYYICSIT